MVVLLVGNKSDLDARCVKRHATPTCPSLHPVMVCRRQVQRSEGEQFAEKHGLIFLETSAKTAENVEKAFVDTAKHIFSKIQCGDLDVHNENHGIKLGVASADSGAAAGGSGGSSSSGGGCC